MTPSEKQLVLGLVRHDEDAAALHGIKNQLILAAVFVAGSALGGIGGLLVGLLVRR